MVLFIFGIIFALVGIGIGIPLVFYTDVEKERVWVDEGNCRGHYEDKKIETHPYRKLCAIPFAIGAVLCAVFIVCSCLTTVKTGRTGVVTKFGEVQDYTFDSGLHAKAPWVKVVQMDNRVQKATVNMESFSSDIQEVKCKYTLNYQISKQYAQLIYKTIGTDYYQTVISPNISKVVKTITARYTAETLVGNRDQLASEIEAMLRPALAEYHIEVAGTSIEDLDFADNFTNAVEAKQVAVQNKLKAVTEQEQKTIEEQQQAERAKIKAAADAEIAKIAAQADMEVAKIGADSAEYQGKKEASIALQRLASINGWTVVMNDDTGINELYKASGEKVSDEELKAGAENLIAYYYTTTWNGILPETYVGDDSASTIILGK